MRRAHSPPLPLPIEKAPQMVVTGNAKEVLNLGTELSLREHSRETSLRHNTRKDRPNNRWIVQISGGTTTDLEEIKTLAISKGLEVVVDGLKVNKEGFHDRGGQVSRHSAKDLRAEKRRRRRHKVAA